MAIARDLSDLPDGRGREGKGSMPDPEAAKFLLPLAQAWYDRYMEAGNDDRAFAVEGRRYRASWAGGCARSLGYRVLENDAKMALANPEHDRFQDVAELDRVSAIREAFRPTNPPSLADLWKMNIGSMVHEAFGASVLASSAFPGTVINVEVAVDLAPDVDGAANVDMVITEQLDARDELRQYDDGDSIATLPARTRVTLLELKTQNGFAYKLATIPFRNSGAEGPKLGHILQVGMAAKALHADRIIIGYLSLENISIEVARKNGLQDHERFAAGWVYDMADIMHLVDDEERRINRVLALVDEGKLPPRQINDGEVPKGARIVSFAGDGKGNWTLTDTDGNLMQAGSTWWCQYCWHRQRCADDGADAAVPVELRLGRPA